MQSSYPGCSSFLVKDASGKPKGQRWSTPRSKNGCLTCKKRKFKCDEQKPECKRCIASNLKCDGYEAPPSRRTRTPLSNNTKPSPTNAIVLQNPPVSIKPPPVTKLFDNDLEYRHFKIYIDQTAIHLAGCHKLDIWTQLVPQVSEADPGIRYAVTAIGALSLSLVRPPNPNEKCQHKAIAYRQYSKSIDIVKNATLRGGTSIERRLLACILYATFEGIHGNAKSMESFVQSGIGMIENYMTSPNPKPIDPIILEVFTVVEIEAGAFIDGGAKLSLNPKYLEQSISHSIPKYYTDLKEARLAVIVIVAKALRWMYDRHHNPSPEPIESELTTHLTRLQTWSAAFAPLLTTSLALPRGSFNLKAAAMIRAHYLAYYLWICTASPTLHTWYRKFTGELWEIVRMIEIICEEGKGEVYAIAVRVVVPLVVVALKFKERGARRRVLELIPRLPRRGGGFVLGSAVGVVSAWMARLEGEGDGVDCGLGDGDGDGDGEEDGEGYVDEGRRCWVTGFEVSGDTFDVRVKQVVEGREVLWERSICLK
ncbi:Zn2/Cys6 DNA-binding protein [Glarea lozoyensis ATCC 20868]|uniref:Zn2/Cys6 DNA-binding protein n=1 Tax=Glarea lozoyensis (strain ATCC 20868 / MF5171) TaxID=1116229 RepID=S3DFB6_GLAL2|nr:Zn2/Cys6 DNA-binding protein [Glarea lozoyensis ATCC 20868]EPE37117.1 Zn2/Cys6 DNA-binding protein [Glarea lozoyensis ATCC 20868]